MANIPVSKQFLHDMRELYKEHTEKLITDEEFSRRNDELIKREIDANEQMGRLLLSQELGNVEKEIASGVKSEAQQQRESIEAQERMQRVERARQNRIQQQEVLAAEQRLLSEKREREQARGNYRREVNNYIDSLELNAQGLSLWFFWLQVGLLVFSALTATMASMDVVPRFWVSISGFLATIIGGSLATFQIQERIYARRKAIAEVRLECQQYEYRIDEYKDIADEEAYIKFTRNITAIQGQQMLQEVELWNPKKEDEKEEKIMKRSEKKNSKDKKEDENDEEDKDNLENEDDEGDGVEEEKTPRK